MSKAQLWPKTAVEAAGLDIRFSVFTPTYNSAAFIQRVFDSLKSQTRVDFEWIIVDDKSTDDTLARIEAFGREETFPIRVVAKPENRGLFDSYNIAVAMAEGEFFVGIGHDDAFVPETLDFVSRAWSTIAPELRNRFCGIAVLCCDSLGQVAESFPEDAMDSNFLEMHFVHKRRAEQWFILRTDVLRHYPFPEGRRVGEASFVWFPMAERYSCRYFNRTLRTYFRDNPAALTQTGPKRYANDLAEANLRLAQYAQQLAPQDISSILMLMARHIRFNQWAGRGIISAMRSYRMSALPLTVIALPIACLMLIRDRMRGSGQV